MLIHNKSYVLLNENKDDMCILTTIQRIRCCIFSEAFLILTSYKGHRMALKASLHYTLLESTYKSL